MMWFIGILALTWLMFPTFTTILLGILVLLAVSPF
tara:strand:+ start:411 stop:515 length:105 start_codon:yes stop_codon:yes gene_type:complete